MFDLPQNQPAGRMNTRRGELIMGAYALFFLFLKQAAFAGCLAVGRFWCDTRYRRAEYAVKEEPEQGAQRIVNNAQRDGGRHAEDTRCDGQRAESIENRLPFVAGGKTDADTADDADIQENFVRQNEGKGGENQAAQHISGSPPFCTCGKIRRLRRQHRHRRNSRPHRPIQSGNSGDQQRKANPQTEANLPLGPG